MARWLNDEIANVKINDGEIANQKIAFVKMANYKITNIIFRIKWQDGK